MIKDKCFYTLTTNAGRVITGMVHVAPGHRTYFINRMLLFGFMIKHIEPVFDELDEDGYI